MFKIYTFIVTKSKIKHHAFTLISVTIYFTDNRVESSTPQQYYGPSERNEEQGAYERDKIHSNEHKDSEFTKRGGDTQQICKEKQQKHEIGAEQCREQWQWYRQPQHHLEQFHNNLFGTLVFVSQTMAYWSVVGYSWNLVIRTALFNIVHIHCSVDYSANEFLKFF